MAIVKISDTGEITIPTQIRRKYHIQSGAKVCVAAEDGVITIRPTTKDAIAMAKTNLKRGA